MIQKISVGRARVAAALLAALVAGCGGGGSGGGGGGGSGGSPPPPPGSPPPSPPPPSAVVARATSNLASVQEGQPFTLDASTSTTSNGSPLTYAWTQVSGPAVTITNPNTAALSLSAAEVTADTVAQFRVNVTAGASSAAATVDVTFSNIAQTPVYNNGSQVLSTVTLSVPPRKILDHFAFGLVGVANTPNDPLTFIDFSIVNDQLIVADSNLGSLPSSAIMEPSNLYVGSSPTNPNPAGSPQFSLIEEGANRLRFFIRSFSSPTLSTGADFTLTRPCAITHGSAMSSSAIYVGQRTGFSIIYAGGPTPVINRAINVGKPFCALFAQRAVMSFVSYNYIVALDTDANVLNLLEPETSTSSNYLLTRQVPVQLNATKPLKLAAWTGIELYGGIGNPGGMALVFTDGVHNGEHRLVIVSLDSAKNIVQQTFSLGLGVPIEVFTDNLDGDLFFPEIVVVASTSPQAEVFEPTNGGGNISAFTGPYYFEVGLGAAAAGRTGTASLPGLLVAFPEKKQVTVIGAAP